MKNQSFHLALAATTADSPKVAEQFLFFQPDYCRIALSFYTFFTLSVFLTNKFAVISDDEMKGE